jgi:hypothetical protein
VIVGQDDRAVGLVKTRPNGPFDGRRGIARRNQDGQLARRSCHLATRANAVVSVFR